MYLELQAMLLVCISLNITIILGVCVWYTNILPEYKDTACILHMDVKYLACKLKWNLFSVIISYQWPCKWTGDTRQCRGHTSDTGFYYVIYIFFFSLMQHVTCNNAMCSIILYIHTWNIHVYIYIHVTCICLYTQMYIYIMYVIRQIYVCLCVYSYRWYVYVYSVGRS